MDSETTLIALVNRQFVYELLARAYAAEPDASFLQILDAEHTRQELGLIAHESTESILAALDAVLETLEAGNALPHITQDYTRIFIGPGTLKADPWESIHLSDVRALFQQELLPIREAYRAAGFLPARYPHVQDDFIGLELDFLAKLAGAAKDAWTNGDQAAMSERLEQSKAFLDEHLLQWIDSLAAAIEREYGDGFYARFTKLAALIAKRDRDILDALSDN
jgi:TorA maturation chaperone TorD